MISTLQLIQADILENCLPLITRKHKWGYIAAWPAAVEYLYAFIIWKTEKESLSHFNLSFIHIAIFPYLRWDPCLQHGSEYIGSEGSQWSTTTTQTALHRLVVHGSNRSETAILQLLEAEPHQALAQILWHSYTTMLYSKVLYWLCMGGRHFCRIIW